jgi:hypothetical protein
MNIYSTIVVGYLGAGISTIFEGSLVRGFHNTIRNPTACNTIRELQLTVSFTYSIVFPASAVRSRNSSPALPFYSILHWNSLRSAKFNSSAI